MSNERFTRWQSHAINQLTFSINLFLGFAVAALGYGLSTLLAQDERLSCGFEIVYIGSLIFLSISVLCGSSAVVSRLLDFRFTAKTVRLSSTDSKGDEAGVYRYKSKAFGKATWRLFWSQIASLGIGILGLIFSLISIYCSN